MKILDLTLQIDKAPLYPGDESAKISEKYSLEKDGANVSNIIMTSHSGTHVDAPSHFVKDARTLEEIPIETFYGPATAINAENPDLSKIKENDIILVHTKNAGLSFEQASNDKTPALTLELAQALLEKKVKLVGIDWFTVDFEPFTVHKLILSKNIPIAENLASVEKLVGKRFTACILPLRLGKLDGAPARAIAFD